MLKLSETVQPSQVKWWRGLEERSANLMPFISKYQEKETLKIKNIWGFEIFVVLF